MKQYYVIPDAYDGGKDWAQLAFAPEPVHACRLTRTYLGHQEIRSFEPVRDGKVGEDVWTVYEFPATGSYGVCPWTDLKARFFKAIDERVTPESNA